MGPLVTAMLMIIRYIYAIKKKDFISFKPLLLHIEDRKAWLTLNFLNFNDR